MKVAFSYNSSRRHITEQYLEDSFDRVSVTHFDLDLFRPNVSVFELLEFARHYDRVPDVLLHADAPSLPRDLARAPLRTVRLDIDSFGWTESRVRWSMLFDYVFVWHLSFVALYQEAGHPKVVALPHAVDASLYQVSNPGMARPLEVGWVGQLGYGQYARRRRIIEPLAAHFKMNDLRKKYSKEETAQVYRNCKIVVNVSRDEFPSEANMRCYEAMAAGALLITAVPTELTEWGFVEGKHFVGWRDEKEIPTLVDYYLHHEMKAAEISRAGQDFTLGNFTFQHCRDKINAVLQEHPHQFFSPARNWSPEAIHLAYIEYYYRYQLLDAILDEFTELRTASPRAYRKGVPMVLKTIRNVLRRSLF